MFENDCSLVGKKCHATRPQPMPVRPQSRLFTHADPTGGGGALGTAGERKTRLTRPSAQRNTPGTACIHSSIGSTGRTPRGSGRRHRHQGCTRGRPSRHSSYQGVDGTSAGMVLRMTSIQTTAKEDASWPSLGGRKSIGPM
jgi:hypothetical protein